MISLASGFTFLTASKTLAFSSSVKALGLFTRTLSAGIFTSPTALIAALSDSSIPSTASDVLAASTDFLA